jgi:hypothetical protein
MAYATSSWCTEHLPTVGRSRDHRGGRRSQVAGLVHVAAFARDVGERVGDLGKDLPPPPGLAEPRPDSDGYLTMTTKGIMEASHPIFQWR